MEINTKDLEPLIVQEAVRQLLDMRSDEESDLFSRLLRDIRKEVKNRVDELFARQAEALVLAEINNAVEAAFEREYQPYDILGEPDGPKTTIRKQVIKLAEDYWTISVDSRTGKPTEGRYNSVSRAQWIMTQALGEDFAKTFKAEAVSAAAEIKDGLRTALRDWIDTELGHLFNVRTKVDKEEGRRV